MPRILTPSSSDSQRRDLRLDSLDHGTRVFTVTHHHHAADGFLTVEVIDETISTLSTALMHEILALHQNLWVEMMDFAKEDSGLCPEGFIALTPIPKRDEKDAPPRWAGASFELGPWVGARVGSHRCPILRPGRESL